MNPIQARNGQILEGGRIVYSDDIYEKHMQRPSFDSAYWGQ